MGCSRPDSAAERPAAAAPGASVPRAAATVDCEDTAEVGALRCAGGRARREGPRLIIQADSGRTVVLQDDSTEGEAYVRHEYRAHLGSIGAHLVEVTYYEGGAFLLVDARTGDSTRLSGRPVVSPDRRRFVTTSMDLEAGYDPNVIEVWRVASPRPVIEFSHQAEGWGPSDAAWRDTATVELRKHEPTPDHSAYRTTPLWLERVGGRWAIRDSAR